MACRRHSENLLRALVAVLVVALGVPTAAQAPIWHVELEVQRQVGVDERTQTKPVPWNPGQSIHENLDLTVEFDVDRERQVVEKSLKTRYNWSRRETTSFIGQLVARVNGNESGTRLEGPDGTPGLEIVWQRELDPQPCDPKLRVYDDKIMAQMARSGMAPLKPANRLTLEFTAIWPGKVDSEEFINGTRESGQETYPTFEQQLEIPYDPKVGRWEGDLDLPLAEIGGFEKVRCHIARKDVQFSVKPDWNKWDLKSDTTLEIDGVDHASEFRYRRWRREWEVDIDYTKIDVRMTDTPSHTLVEMGAYPMVGAWRLNSDWTEEKDNTEAKGRITATFPPPVDPLPPPGEPPNWPARRWTIEYLVAVDGFPELGYLYHFVVLETTPLGHYDGYLWPSFPVQPQEWCKVKTDPQPQGDIYTKGAQKFVGAIWYDKAAVDAARRRLWPPWQKETPYEDPNAPWYRWGDE